MKKRIWSILLAIVLTCILSGPVKATLILDQEQDIYDFENYRPSSGYKEGQSFTAGLTGTLKQIDMGFLKTINGDGTVEIFSGEGNQGPLLQTVAVQIYSEDNGEINYNSFIVDVPIENGLQYTFYFEPNSLTMPDPWYFGTSQTNPYVGGEWHEVSYGDPSSYSIGDIVFRTWVEPFPEPATTYYVDGVDGDDDNDGLSPEMAFATIQKGIDSADDGDTVIAAPGTYTGEGNRDIDFLGKAITVRSESGPETCIINCEGTESESHRGFYFHSGEGPDSVLSGLTITNGYAPKKQIGRYIRMLGGAIYCDYSSPVITNCIFRENISGWKGGAIMSSGSKPKIINCLFQNNVAQWGGGLHTSAVYGNSQGPIMINCTFIGNFANNGRGGGGVYCDSTGKTTLTNCILWGNRYQGGSGERGQISLPNPVISYCCIEGSFGSAPLLAPDGYHLLAGSPCIDAGTNSPMGGLPATDIDGQPRVIGARVDIGADEFIEEPAVLVGLDITGPEEISENSVAQYSAIVLYESNYTGDVTTLAIWSLEPQEYATINQYGRLTTGRIEPSETITIYAQYTFREVTVEAEMAVRISPPVDLEIAGPEEVWGTNPAQYEAVVYYDNGQTDTVTNSALWWAEPNSLETIIDDHGLLHTERIDIPEEYITIYAQYTATGITLQTEMTVRVSLPVDLEITGPQEVRGSCPAQYEAVVYYDNGQTDTVTDSALWWAEPNTLATIEGGLLRTQQIDEPRDIIIYSQYTVTGVTLQAEMEVAVTLPQTLYVPSEYETIQAAIDAAQCGDTVIVADGSYTGEGNRDIDFLGKAITVRSENGPQSCIIDCENSGRGFYFHNHEGTDSILEGFTITNGYDYDAAIRCWESSPTIKNCTIVGNQRGGIYCGGESSPTIKNCNIIENQGGGILCDRSNSTITNCIISDNVSWGRGGRGGISIFQSIGLINNCTITGNSAPQGGGIACVDSSPTITNCTISGNSADIGGGMDNVMSSPTVTNCTFSGNFAEYGGGGICCSYYSSPTITNCTISSNFASGYKSYAGHGGAIHCWLSSPTITNCTITGNSADGEDASGGGIYCTRNSNPRITNCTFTGNSAPNGNALSCVGWDPSNIDLTNCILADGGNEIWKNNDSTITITYSDVQGGWLGEGNIDADPRFAFPNDYHLMPDSPCIDAGTNEPYDGLPDTDFEGITRPLDGNGDGSAIADMGAYEYSIEPRIACSRLVFDLARLPRGPNPDDQILSLRNAGGGTMAWEIVEDCAWLEIIPTSGTSAGQINEVVLRTNATDLPRGDYICELQIVSEQAVNSPKIVTVNLHAMDFLEVPAMYPTIQAAIVSAFEGETIFVAPGIYTGPGNRDIDFLGKAITVRSLDPNDPNIVVMTIVDCEEKGRGFSFVSSEGKNSILEGLTIINGRASRGGGIYCYAASPTIRNCIISNNKAQYGGGIKLSRNSNPIIENCAVSENWTGARGQGGGIQSNRSSPRIINCEIVNNLVRGSGGGVFCWDGNTEIRNCIISRNIAEKGEHAWGRGAGIFYIFGNPDIVNCSITDNFAYNGNGGGFCCTLSNPHITNCILWGNTAGEGNQISVGYPGYSSESNLTVSYSDVHGGESDVYVNPVCTLIWGPGNIDADPWFVEPGYWDTDGVWVEGDYHLLAGSPCIDAGDNTAVPPDTTDLDGDGNTAEPIPWDLDGNPRFVDRPDTEDTGNGTPPIVDMGAYETALSDPVELLDILAQDIIDLGLHQGIENSLLVKLDTALQKLEDDNQNNDVAAINSLQAFINAVEAQRGKKIPEEDADDLIAAALQIINLLSTG